jgi:hypothetical protein
MSKPLILTSPKGKAIFPHLTEADYKFKPEGEYHVKLECLKSESVAIIKQIKDLVAKTVQGQHNNNPNVKIKYAPLPFEEEGENVIFNFKMKASGTRRDNLKTFTQHPVLVNADLTPLGNDVQIWGDSKLRITFEPHAYISSAIGLGVTLRLKTVQVIELVTGKGSNTLGELKVEPMTEPKVSTNSETPQNHNLY